MRSIEAIQTKLVEVSVGPHAMDIGKGAAAELSQYLTIDQVLSTASPVFDATTIALLGINGEDARQLRSQWITHVPDRSNILKRAQQYMERAISLCVYHKGLQSFDTLNRIELWLWLLENEGPLYQELSHDRTRTPQFGAPYVSDFMDELKLNRPRSAYSDVFTEMAAGRKCPWCISPTDPDLGCQ